MILMMKNIPVLETNKDVEDEYEEAKRIDERSYDEMQIADYILNNSDRHVGNWGFYFDINENQLKKCIH